jgi:LCP family protein required for cell wall assembly
MVDAPDPGRGNYKRYRANRKLRARQVADPAAALAELRALRREGEAGAPATPHGRAPRRRRGFTWGRAARWVLYLIIGWIGLSVLIFVISSFTATGIPSAAVAALDSGGLPPFASTTILVLGTDGRTPGSKEPGASGDSESGGPVRSDTMMLIHTGAGHTSRLSIPRDTLVDLPGYGLQKINAAYFYGGPAGAIDEVRRFLGIKINHVILINFTNFPALVDSMGGVNYTGGCVDSQISGGVANGGYTLVLPAGTHHLDGQQALVLARTRENLCNPAWTDITREMNQQALLSAMKSQVFSPLGFVRLPLIAWQTPQTLITDMDVPTLAGVAASLTLFGAGTTSVLPTQGEVLPGVGDVQTISNAARQAAVAQFLAR